MNIKAVFSFPLHSVHKICVLFYIFFWIPFPAWGDEKIDPSSVFHAFWSILENNYYNEQFDPISRKGRYEFYKNKLIEHESLYFLYSEIFPDIIKNFSDSHIYVRPPDRYSPVYGSLPVTATDSILSPPYIICSGIVMGPALDPIAPRIVAISDRSPLFKQGVRSGWVIENTLQGEGASGDSTITFLDDSSNIHHIRLPATKENVSSIDEINTSYDKNIRGQKAIKIDNFGIVLDVGRKGHGTEIGYVIPHTQASDRDIPVGADFKSMFVSVKPDKTIVSSSVFEKNGRTYNVESSQGLCLNSGAFKDRDVSITGNHNLYIRFDRFDNEAALWLDKIVPDSYGNIIIDLRRNIGGESRALSKILAMFIGPSKKMGNLIVRGHSIDVYTSGGLKKRTFAHIRVLIGPVTSSSAEIMAECLKFYLKSILYGNATSGSVLLARKFPLPDGGVVTIPTGDFRGLDGKKIEGFGVMPDVDVHAFDIRKCGDVPFLLADKGESIDAVVLKGIVAGACVK